MEDPEIIIEKLREYFSEQDFPVEENEKKYKLKAKCTIQGDQTIVSAKVEQVEDGVNCLRLQKVEGNKMDFFEIFNEIQTHLEEANMIL